MWLRWRLLCLGPLLLGLIVATSPVAHAVPCTGALLGYTETGNLPNTSQNVCGTYCHDPTFGAVTYTTSPPGCDPSAGNCTVKATVPTQFPGNHQNFSVPGFSWATLILSTTSGGFIGQCGVPGAEIVQDKGNATWSASLSCADAGVAALSRLVGTLAAHRRRASSCAYRGSGRMGHG